MKRLLWIVFILFAGMGLAQEGPTAVGELSVPTITPAVRDLPIPLYRPDFFGQEMKRRDEYGMTVPPYEGPLWRDPLMDLQSFAAPPSALAFGTPIHNYNGLQSSSSPPDDTGDVGPTHYLQGINGTTTSPYSFGNSAVGIFNKSTGAIVNAFQLDSLSSTAPCNSGYCDPIVLYDWMADRWMISEFPSSGGHFCVYVSTTNDPTGTWYAYYFANVESGTPDYPKYGVWPQNGNGGSYFVGVNAGSSGRDIIALDRAKMLAGQPATWQKFTVPTQPNYTFQLVLPATMQGKIAPPNGAPGIVARPRDDEAQDGASTPSYDLMEMWAISVNWTTPASSTITQLPSLHIADYDCTMCGVSGNWNCMPQSGTTQQIDPIREPLHFPFVYRKFADHESMVGTFVEDVDGTDHAALRWFELRGTGSAWSVYQEGVIGGEANVHRSVGAISIDSSSNMAIGYTRTGTSLYPSIYYRGRLATDTLGTMPQGEYVIQDATTSKTGNERWGDYAGMGVDPSDDCTFWFTTEYGGSGQTKIAAFKFDACGCLAVPGTPTASALVPGNNQINVSWNDSATTTITRYWVYRGTVAGGPYSQIAEVPDSSPGAGNGAGYTYQDLTVSGGTRYYYIVKSNDGAACTSAASNEVNALATGACLLAPTFAGLTSVTNAAGATCTLNLTWSAGTAQCAGPLRYNVYRSTSTGFTPGPANRIAQNVNATSYQDMDQLTYNTIYYYVVRAVDSGNSIEEANAVEKNGKPTGILSPGTFTAGAESGDPSVVLNAPWATSTTYKRTGTYSYSTGATYPTSACGALTTAPLVLGTNPVLTFYHIYSTEAGWDGGRVEISTNGGSSWTALTPTPAYPGTMGYASNACTWAVGTACYIGNSTTYPTAWQLATIALSAYNGQTVLLRWNFTTDGSGSGTGANPGWYIDDIQITNVNVPSACATGSNCANNPSQLSVTPDGPLTLCTGTAQLLTATPTGGSGTTYQWYDGASSIGGATASTYSANTTGNHSYNCQAKGTGCSSAMADASPTSITWQAEPTFAGLTSVSNPQQATCRLDLAWSAGSTPCAGGVTYNVYRSTTPAFTPAPGNRIAAGLSAITYQDANGLASGTMYYYKTRAVTVANGTEEANVVERSGAPTGAGGGPFTLVNENFEGTWGPQGDVPPTGWTIEDHGSVPGTWNNNDWYKYSKGGTYLNVARIYYSPVENQDDWLVTPAFTIPAGASTADVQFDHYFYVYASNEFGYVDYSSTQHPAWTTLATYSATTGTSSVYAHATLDLLPYAGDTNAKIRFRYVANNGWYWELDNVKVSGVVNNACATGSAAPPPVKDTGANAAKFTKGAGNTLNVTYDAASCSAQKVVILYNAIGTWTGYAGCAWNAGGNGGSTSFDSGVSTNRWYNLVWTQGTTAGHPGFATSGARTWNVGTNCGMTTDDKSHSTCP